MTDRIAAVPGWWVYSDGLDEPDSLPPQAVIAWEFDQEDLGPSGGRVYAVAWDGSRYLAEEEQDEYMRWTVVYQPDPEFARKWGEGQIARYFSFSAGNAEG